MESKPHLFLVSPESRITVHMNDHFIEKVVIWYGINFVEVMITFECRRVALFPHQPNEFLIQNQIKAITMNWLEDSKAFGKKKWTLKCKVNLNETVDASWELGDPLNHVMRKIIVTRSYQYLERKDYQYNISYYREIIHRKGRNEICNLVI